MLLRLLRLLRIYLPRLYAVRFPLMLAGLTLLLVPLGLLWVPAMFRSMFVLGPFGLAAASLAASVAAFTVMAARRVTLLYGPDRLETSWPAIDPHIGRRQILGHLCIALPLIVTTVVLSVRDGEVNWFTALLMAGAGIAGAAVIVFVATLFQAWLTPPADPMPGILIPAEWELVRRLHENIPAPSWLFYVRLAIRRFRPILGPGYLNAEGDLLPGHALSVGLAVVSGGVYALGWLVQPGTAMAAHIPAIVFVLTTAIVWTWALSGAAFYLDRYRVPVVLTVLALFVVVWSASRSDHHFLLRDPVVPWSELRTPGQIAAARRHPLLTVVAVDGGGIQASAWGAQVLTGISRVFPDFPKSARLISAVSGGAVGTMYFVAAAPEHGALTARTLNTVASLSRRGSLNEAAWGIAYPDLFRVFFPIPPGWRFVKDRGWALQTAWERGLTVVPGMSDWVAGVNAGWRPAVSFNSVAVENGQRASFTTFRAPPEWQLLTIPDIYGARDLAVTTAARLSAAFPFVSPVARAWPESDRTPAYHYADGGYYDNTGMGLAMRWLDHVLKTDEASYRGQAVAFVRIRSKREEPTVRLADRGWQYQLIGPLLALMSVRVAAQAERSETEFEVLQRMWCRAGIDIRTFDFVFGGSDPPLSWQLSPVEQRNIDRWWSDRELGRDNQKALANLLKLAASPVSDCLHNPE